MRCREKRDEVRALNDKMEDLRRQEEQALYVVTGYGWSLTQASREQTFLSPCVRV